MAFSRLLRKSNLASFEPSTSKVYLTSPEMSKRGDFGFKMDLSKSRRTPVVELSHLDRHHTVKVKDGSHVALRYALYSQYAKSAPSIQANGADEENDAKPPLSTVSDDEFQRLLEKARSQRKEFRASTEKAPFNRRSADYLCSYIGYSRHSTVANDYPCSLGYLSVPAPPNTIKTPLRVKGRILNAVRGGYAVGVGGLVAFLPTDTSAFLSIAGWDPYDRRKTYQFYVEELRWKRDGTPMLKLSASAPTSDKGDRSSVYTKSTNDELESLLSDLMK